MTFIAVFFVIVGVGMIAQWIFSLITRQVPELKDEPLKIIFHLIAELSTALILIVAGLAVLGKSLVGYPLSLIGAGMLLYTVINSSGYFAHKRQWGFVGLFVGLLTITLISVVQLFNHIFDLILIG
ncbi:MAG: hypothetical protein ACNA8H_04020 [Anaerolineales bacterium]